MPTRACGCHTLAIRRNTPASARSPPSPSKPVAPIHHVPGMPAAGATCGLADKKAALVRASSRVTQASSQSRTWSAAQRPRAAATVMPARTCNRAAAAVTARSRWPSRRARSCSSQCGGGAAADAALASASGAYAASGDIASSHTAPIGNLGILTHATRSVLHSVTHFVAGTFHLHPLCGAAFFDRDEQAARLRPHRGAGAGTDTSTGTSTGTGLPVQSCRQIERLGSPLG